VELEVTLSKRNIPARPGTIISVESIRETVGRWILKFHPKKGARKEIEAAWS
jgi:hypothetical protein